MYALQTEEESGESQFASSLEIDSSHDLTIANYHGYRVTHSEQPYPYAVRVANSRNVRFRNVHVDSNSSIAVCDGAGVCRQGVRPNKVPYANAIVDETQHLQIRDREFAALDLTDGPPRSATPDRAEVRKLATGFFNASGAAVDGKGQLYFVDARFQRIYRWNQQAADAEVVRDAPLGPVNLVFDRAGDLIVVSSTGMELTAYAFRPDQPQAPEAKLQRMTLEPAAEHNGMTVAMPVDYWFNGDFSNTLSATQPYTYTTLQDLFTRSLGTRTTHAFVAPDHSLFVPTNLPIVQGEPFFGTKWAPVLYSYGLVKGQPGSLFYATNEAEQRTYRGSLRPDGSLAEILPFLERGGESLAVDKAGNIYLAAGQIYVYSAGGKLLKTIHVPERPHDVVFGGADGSTLYVLSEHSLYATQAVAGASGLSRGHATAR
jgi:sugar lactone lactonase YvrE